jgi:hypothetical protein
MPGQAHANLTEDREQAWLKPFVVGEGEQVRIELMKEGKQTQTIKIMDMDYHTRPNFLLVPLVWHIAGLPRTLPPGPRTGSPGVRDTSPSIRKIRGSESQFTKLTMDPASPSLGFNGLIPNTDLTSITGSQLETETDLDYQKWSLRSPWSSASWCFFASHVKLSGGSRAVRE